MILKTVFDLSTSTRVELGIKVKENFETSVHFAIRNIRNIEVPLSLEAFDNYYKNREAIRNYLEKGIKHSDIQLDSKTLLRFI